MLGVETIAHVGVYGFGDVLDKAGYTKPRTNRFDIKNSPPPPPPPRRNVHLGNKVKCEAAKTGSDFSRIDSPLPYPPLNGTMTEIGIQYTGDRSFLGKGDSPIRRCDENFQECLPCD